MNDTELFDLDSLLDNIDSDNIIEDSDATFEVIPLEFTAQDGAISEKIYVTTRVDTAEYFNKDVDAFSSASFFLLPEGAELKNETVLSKFTIGEAMMCTENEIRQSNLETFNNQYLRAMLCN